LTFRRALPAVFKTRLRFGAARGYPLRVRGGAPPRCRIIGRSRGRCMVPLSCMCLGAGLCDRGARRAVRFISGPRPSRSHRCLCDRRPCRRAPARGRPGRSCRPGASWPSAHSCQRPAAAPCWRRAPCRRGSGRRPAGPARGRRPGRRRLLGADRPPAFPLLTALPARAGRPRARPRYFWGSAPVQVGCLVGRFWCQLRVN
jgi:hypothetical protein